MQLKNKVLKFINHHMILFETFNHVYLFGSVLGSSNCQNDVDILIIYEKYSKELEKALRIIQEELEKEINLSVDLTALSIREEEETEFLEKIKHQCMKVK